jgi:hypothetical protein
LQVDEAVPREAVGAAAAQLYALMSRCLEGPEADVIRITLEGGDVVWVGDGFVPAERVALELPTDFRPYLYTAPEELGQFRELMMTLGVSTQMAEIWFCSSFKVCKGFGFTVASQCVDCAQALDQAGLKLAWALRLELRTSPRPHQICLAAGAAGDGCGALL